MSDIDIQVVAPNVIEVNIGAAIPTAGADFAVVAPLTKAGNIVGIRPASAEESGSMSSTDKAKVNTLPSAPANQSEAKAYELAVPASQGPAAWSEKDTSPAFTDAEIGEKAFKNPPGDLNTTQKTAGRTAIGAGTSDFSGNYADLTGKPSIPVDTTIWKGPYSDGTAYPAGSIVTDGGKVFLALVAVPDTNTANPVDGSTWAELDVGSPNDLVGVERTGDVLTFTRRDGSTVAIDVAPVDALTDADFALNADAYGVNYGSDFTHWALDEATTFASFFTGEPSASTIVQFGNLTPKDVTNVTRVRIRKTVRASLDYFGNDTKALPQPAIGDAIKFRPFDANSPTATFTVSAAASGGSGNGAYWELTGVMTQSANFNPGAQAFMHASQTDQPKQGVPGEAIYNIGNLLLRLATHAMTPAQAASNIVKFITAEKVLDPLSTAYTAFRAAFRDLLASIFPKQDGTGWTSTYIAKLRDAVLPEPEHDVQAGWRWRGMNPTIDDPVTIPNANDIGEVNPAQVWLNPSNANLPDVLRYAKRDHLFYVWKDAANYIVYKVNQDQTGSGNGNERYFAFTRTVVGALAVNDAVELRLTGPFVTVDRLVGTIGDSPNDINVPTEKAVADYAGGKVSEGDFEELLDIEFPHAVSVTWAGNVSNNGEAVVSTDNTPANSKFGTDTFIGVKLAAGDNRDLIDSINAEDYLIAKKGDTHILSAEIAGRDVAPGSDVRRLWVKEILYKRGLDDYDDFPNGVGEIRFQVQAEAGASVSFQNTAPSDPETGDLWWDADSATNPLATKRGVHRRCVAELSGTTGSAAPGLSLMTASYTPQAANARIFVRMRIAASCVGNSDNDYSQLCARVKRGSGNYKRMDEGADGFTAIHGERMWQYSDNTARAHYDEFELEPKNNTDTIKVNVSIYMKDAASVSSTTGRLNRWGTNRNIGPSFVEIYELAAGGEMTRTTITALDAA